MESIYSELLVMQKVFSHAKFYIRLSFDQLEEIISNARLVTVYPNCHKCSPQSKPLLVHARSGQWTVTIADVVKAMINYDFEVTCRHVYFSGLIRITDTEFQAKFSSSF